MCVVGGGTLWQPAGIHALSHCHAPLPAAPDPLTPPCALPCHPQRHMERFKEEVLQAERAVLYASGFALDLPYPYRFVMNEISRLQAKEGQSKSRAQLQALLQATWNLLNDRWARGRAEALAWGVLRC